MKIRNLEKSQNQLTLQCGLVDKTGVDILENIILNNGQSVIIGSNKDIIEVIEEHCSYELASLISGKLVDIDAEKLYAEERAATDADIYLSSLEEIHSVMNDTLSSLEEIVLHIQEAKRINKDMICGKLKGLVHDIKNEL